jgi:hypothetical protein
VINITHQCSVLEADINETKRPFSFKVAVKRRTFVLGIHYFLAFLFFPFMIVIITYFLSFASRFLHSPFTHSHFSQLSFLYSPLVTPSILSFAFHTPFEVSPLKCVLQLLILVQIWKIGFTLYVQYVFYINFLHFVKRSFFFFH